MRRLLAVSTCVLSLVWGSCRRLDQASDLPLDAGAAADASEVAVDRIEAVPQPRAALPRPRFARIEGGALAVLSADRTARLVLDGGALYVARGARRDLLLAPATLGPVAPTQRAAWTDRGEHRAALDRGAGIEEWYETVVNGVEQGWTFARRPVSGSESVELRLRVGPEVAARQASPTHVVLALDDVEVEYGSLSALDAAGRVLPSTLALADDGIVLSIDDTDATYPVIVDPLVVFSSSSLVPGDELRTPRYAEALTIDGDVAVVGQPDGRNTGGVSTGAVHVFRRAANNAWPFERALRLSHLLGGAEFGSSVDVRANWLVVGSPGEDGGRGAAYIVDLDGGFDGGGQPLSYVRLVAPLQRIGERFGHAVAIGDGRIVIGTAGTLAARAYTFASSGSAWRHESTLPTHSVAAGDLFGSVVDIDPMNPGLVAIGAPATSRGAGAVYVYDRVVCCRTPTPVVLAAPSGAARFGTSLSIYEGRVGIAAMTSGLAGAELHVAHDNPGHWVAELALRSSGTLSDPGYSYAYGSANRAPHAAIAEGRIAVLGFPNAKPPHVLEASVTGVVDAPTVPGLSEVISESGVIHRGRAIAATRDAVLVARLEGDLGAVRVHNVLLANGSPCSSSRECGSGYCVDEVCCDAACGGSSTSDCQACSTAHGAANDGVCSVTSGTVCRAAAGPCDVAETCGSSGSACPPDARRPAGTTCGAAGDPSQLCDADDTCDGASANCVSRARPAGTVCRAASSEADPAESCDGSSTSCPPDAPMLALCSDGGDNDGDGLADCRDPDCRQTTVCVERCSNGADDDGDLHADCFDSDCAAEPSCAESCTNAEDDDGDNLADCLGPDCDGSAACAVEDCLNAIDDDRDALIDCMDPQCATRSECGVSVPADPYVTAPPLPRGPAVPFAYQVSFLHSGSRAVQSGLSVASLDPRTVAAIFGYVRDARGAPQPGARVSVVGRPELGATRTRADGRYDLVVAGGGSLTVDIELAGHPSSQRTVEVGWNEWREVPEVVLVPYDRRATRVVLDGRTTTQVARASTSSDASGERTATLLFRPGTRALAELPDASSMSLDTLHVRATEFTVGDRGPERMPGTLPPTSRYTYAVEFSVDEAVALGARHVRFSQPVIMYVENFREFTVGQAVPAGYYDREQGRWLPDESGHVLALVGSSGGVAQIDLDGDGDADDPSVLGIAADELAALAALYEGGGRSYWRVPLLHFTSWDCNWGGGPPADAAFHENEPTSGNHEPDDCYQTGSVISCMNRTVGESVGIAGTPYRLHYSSDRAPGFARERTVRVPLFRGEPPASLARVVVKATVAGRTFEVADLLRAELSDRAAVEWTWDGLDAAGRAVTGTQWARIQVDLYYPFRYEVTPRFAASSARIRVGGSGRRRGAAAAGQPPLPPPPVILSTHYAVRVGGATRAAAGDELGGWQLDVHHNYDAVAGTVAHGDGTRHVLSAGQPHVTRIAGACGRFAGISANGDGGPARAARLTSSAAVVTAGEDGSIYIGDLSRVRVVDTEGTIRTWLDLGSVLGDEWRIVDLDWSAGALVALVQRTGSYRLYRLRGPGDTQLIAGGAQSPVSGLRALDVSVVGATTVAAAADGTIYLAGRRDRVIGGSAPGPTFGVHVIRPDGSWEVLLDRHAGPCNRSNLVAGEVGTDGAIDERSVCDVTGLAVAPDGSIYFTEQLQASATDVAALRRLTPWGTVVTVAGDLSQSTEVSEADGVEPFGGYLPAPRGLGVQSDGAPVFLARHSELGRPGSPTVFTRALHSGVLRTIAGSYEVVTPDEGLALATRSFVQSGGDVDVLADDSILVAEHGCVRRIESASGASPLRDFWGRSGDGDQVRIARADGSRIDVFDADGRHLRSEDAWTGRVLTEFGYDASRRLVAIVDADGNRTTIEWPAAISDPVRITARSDK